MEMVDVFAPKKRVEIIEEQFRETWNTDEIKKAIVKRNKLFKNWIHSPIGTICEKYKTARNNFSNLIKKEELKEIFQKLGEKLTPKKTSKRSNRKNIKAKTQTFSLMLKFQTNLFFLSDHFCPKL